MMHFIACPLSDHSTLYAIYSRLILTHSVAKGRKSGSHLDVKVLGLPKPRTRVSKVNNLGWLTSLQVKAVVKAGPPERTQECGRVNSVRPVCSNLRTTDSKGRQGRRCP